VFFSPWQDDCCPETHQLLIFQSGMTGVGAALKGQDDKAQGWPRFLAANPGWQAFNKLPRRGLYFMSQSLSAVYLHAVFSTKERWRFLRDPVICAEMHAMLSGISKRLDCPSIIAGGTDDHIHQLIRFSRTITQAEWIKEIKRETSIWIKQRDAHLRKFAWQSGYGMFSVSPTNIEVVRQYIVSQEEHHRKFTFQDEFRILLKQHGLEWDERYVWD
jgi:putative transposase